ncbi:hypothetical protein BV898_15652 [Hypsibius exemplaris]|uniref:G-protein coupled receptors family 1 profile domain-containing protein n=1 Tax=Hypsibius exemplaris TaxID=2072580 RepID=A0A9X6NEF5_HYPEX|nr:hypothetical protein BV898_15652 [Hypsibius exemplaris]
MSNITVEFWSPNDTFTNRTGPFRCRSETPQDWMARTFGTAITTTQLLNLIIFALWRNKEPYVLLHVCLTVASFMAGVSIIIPGPLGYLPYTPVNTFLNVFIGICVLTWANSAVIFANFAISVDRWLSVEFAIKYRASITHRKTLVAGVLTTFGATLILNVPTFTIFWKNQHFEPCAGLRTDALAGGVAFLIWLALKGPVLFPLLFLSQLRIMIVAVGLKLQAYRRCHRQEVLPAGHGPPQEILVIYWGSFTCSMTIVFFTLISNVPNYLMVIVQGVPLSARLVGVYMTLVQHCISPVIYLLFWPLYRQAVIRLFRRVRAVVRAVIKPNTRVGTHSRKRREPQIPQIPGEQPEISATN